MERQKFLNTMRFKPLGGDKPLTWEEALSTNPLKKFNHGSCKRDMSYFLCGWLNAPGYQNFMIAYLKS